MPGPNIDKLYESYMNIGDYEGDDKSFGEDIYDFFYTDIPVSTEGITKYSRLSGKEWDREYGRYLPTFDPAQIKLAERKRDLDYEKSLNLYSASKEATDRVYRSEMDTLGTKLKKELGGARHVAGASGLRSGTIADAIETTLSSTYEKSKDLGD